MPVRYKPSNYNHAISYRDKVLLFNGVSSALVMVDPSRYDRLRPYLFGKPDGPSSSTVKDVAGPPKTRFRPPVMPFMEPFEMETIDDAELTKSLQGFLRARYIVEDTVDELAYLRQRYRRHQEDAPLLITVVTTMDCNLGCYYCYENKYPSFLSKETSNRIFDYIREGLKARKHQRMHLGWFGGEPMLNSKAIDYLSEKAIAHCDTIGVRYTSSMVSKGTVWPADSNEAVAFVTRTASGAFNLASMAVRITITIAGITKTEITITLLPLSTPFAV
jgi:sulfatase maturation enzyme AslB (radical SAM superfamily)